MNDVTRILHALEHGNANAEELLPLVYEELRKLAASKMANEVPGQTLQPTALVHEAWLRLVGKEGHAQFKNRAHFFGAAAEAMRRILIENARPKRTPLHGGDQRRVDLQEIEIAAQVQPDELLALDDALNRLALQDQSKAELVKLRYFVGLTLEEAAEILGISLATAKRQWTFARAWLHVEITTLGPQRDRGGGAG
jgi:RNA polymerase sigma factor (TIGR02999 family)